MSDVVSGVGELFGVSKADRARKSAEGEAASSRAYQTAMWERQFGEVSDALKKEMLGILGYETGLDGQPVKSPENNWLRQFKEKMKMGIEEGIRPAEETARAALLDRVRANPKSMSTQGYAKGLKDIVREGASQRGKAYREGLSTAELTPYNLSLAFMGRTPFAPNVSPVYSPNYPTDVEGAKLMGSGLSEIAKWGTNAYSSLFGPREDSPSSGFENFMGDEGGNLGMGDLSDLEGGGVF